jgi:hypothetical protein
MNNPNPSCDTLHAEIIACDFFCVDSVLLRRLYVLVFIDLAR